ncbi:hypothetical protein ACXNSR_22800 [Streptomyces sp. NC-S4]
MPRTATDKDEPADPAADRPPPPPRTAASVPAAHGTMVHLVPVAGGRLADRIPGSSGASAATEPAPRAFDGKTTAPWPRRTMHPVR